jgi:hypothetical protein
MGRIGQSGRWLGRFGLDRVPLWATLISIVGSVSFKETGPLLLLHFYILFY